MPTAPMRDSGRGGVGLILTDVITDFDFTGGDRLRDNAQAIVDPILALRTACDRLEVPAIFVNDNFGEWHSEKSKLVERACQAGNGITSRLAPREQDYFVIKPQFSGFYATNLPLLLPKLGISRLIITGVATDICVLFTAADAHMRDYALWVPRDTVAAEDTDQGEAALRIMEQRLGAETAATCDLGVEAWMARLDRQGVR